MGNIILPVRLPPAGQIRPAAHRSTQEMMVSIQESPYVARRGYPLHITEKGSLGMTTSAVNRSANAQELPEIKNYL